MANEISDKVEGQAVLVEYMSALGKAYRAEPVNAKRIMFEDVEFVHILSKMAVNSGYKVGEEFEYTISIKKKQ